MVETYLLFQAEGATYAVPSGQVEFVEMVDKVTWVPNAPEFVEGVTSVRGQIIPVVSIRRRFHLDPQPVSLRTRLIVIRLKERLIGLMVDSSREFARISPEQVLPPPETLTGRVVNYLDGVIRQPSRLILIVNLPKLFSEEEAATIALEERK